MGRWSKPSFSAPPEYTPTPGEDDWCGRVEGLMEAAVTRVAALKEACAYTADHPPSVLAQANHICELLDLFSDLETAARDVMRDPFLKEAVRTAWRA